MKSPKEQAQYFKSGDQEEVIIQIKGKLVGDRYYFSLPTYWRNESDNVVSVAEVYTDNPTKE